MGIQLSLMIVIVVIVDPNNDRLRRVAEVVFIIAGRRPVFKTVAQPYARGTTAVAYYQSTQTSNRHYNRGYAVAVRLVQRTDRSRNRSHP